jgi:Tfp pilus assembly protein PilO
MNEHERSLAISGASIVLAILIGYFGLRPMIDTYQQNVLTNRSVAAQVQSLKDRKTQLSELQHQISKYQNQVNQLNIAAPSAADYPEVLVQLTALAAKSQVTLSSVLPSRAEDTAEEVPVTVTARGSYPQLLGFAQGIEKNLRPITVTSMTFLSGNDTKQAQPLTATIQLTFARTASKGAK